jgi:hypothetical protein
MIEKLRKYYDRGRFWAEITDGVGWRTVGYFKTVEDGIRVLLGLYGASRITENNKRICYVFDNVVIYDNEIEIHKGTKVRRVKR